MISPEPTIEPEMITLGRTANHDLSLVDSSVSRFHLYFQQKDEGWVVCDAGSRNGTSLNGDELVKREPTPIASSGSLKIGSLKGTFLEVDALFDWLSRRA